MRPFRNKKDIEYIKERMVNRGRPKNAPNKVQEITFNNFDKIQSMKLDGMAFRVVVKEPTRYFFECWLKTRLGCNSLSTLDSGALVFPNSAPATTRLVLSDLLQICPTARLVKEPKTKVWVLYL